MWDGYTHDALILVLYHQLLARLMSTNRKLPLLLRIRRLFELWVMDPKGEFFVVVVGDNENKFFKGEIEVPLLNSE